jgi:hypothetical protein
MSKSNLDANADVIARKLTGLKDQILRTQLSSGQILFLNTYMGVIIDQFDKCFDVLDVDKYKEMLIELED